MIHPAYLSSGLGIAYLEGLVGFGASGTNIIYPSAMGSVVRLPDEKEFRDMTYSNRGWSFEAWVHVSGINDVNNWKETIDGTDVLQFHRLLLSCENTGATEASTVSVNRVGT